MSKWNRVNFNYEKYASWKLDRNNRIAKLNNQWGVGGWSAFMYLSDIFHCNKNKPIQKANNYDIKHLYHPDVLERFIEDCVKFKLLCTDDVNIWLPVEMINPYALSDGEFLNTNYEHTHGE